MMRNTLLALCLAASAGAQSFSIDQPIGTDTFGARSGGQIFTPGVGVTPSPGTLLALPLTRFTLYFGNMGAMTPSTTTFLNIYDGNPNSGGVFVGSSINSIDTTPAAGLTFHAPLVWDFAALPLGLTTQYWAILSSTNVAGNVPLEVSLETAPRLGPDVYLGGVGIVGNLAQQANGVDCKFRIDFQNGTLASFATSGSGCPSSVGLANLTAPLLPVIGQTLQVDIGNVSSVGLSLMVIGLSDTSWNGLPLPVQISLFLPADPSCLLTVSVDVLAGPLPVTAGVATMTLTIPNDPLLSGVPIYVQGAQFEVGGTSLTEKGTAIIGY